MPRRLSDSRYVPKTDPVPLGMPRGKRIEELRLYFVNYLCEDPWDGSSFDVAVLNALDQIQREYPEPK